jgi:hypothetical protein
MESELIDAIVLSKPTRVGSLPFRDRWMPSVNAVTPILISGYAPAEPSRSSLRLDRRAEADRDRTTCFSFSNAQRVYSTPRNDWP